MGREGDRARHRQTGEAHSAMGQLGVGVAEIRYGTISVHTGPWVLLVAVCVRVCVFVLYVYTCACLSDYIHFFVYFVRMSVCVYVSGRLCVFVQWDPSVHRLHSLAAFVDPDCLRDVHPRLGWYAYGMLPALGTAVNIDSCQVASACGR